MIQIKLGDPYSYSRVSSRRIKGYKPKLTLPIPIYYDRLRVKRIIQSDDSWQLALTHGGVDYIRNCATIRVHLGRGKLSLELERAGKISNLTTVFSRVSILSDRYTM